MSEESYTVLFGDCVGVHSAPLTGYIAERGFEPAHLRTVASELCQKGFSAEIIELTHHCKKPNAEEACVLVIRGYDPQLAEEALSRVRALTYDTFTYSYGAMKKAHSRHMVYAATEGREAQPDKGVHTVLPWSKLDVLDKARVWVTEALGTTDVQSACILRYPDIRSNGIRWHGDGERRQTILYRLGDNSIRSPLHLQWYLQGDVVSEPITIPLHHGDFLVSSAKAVGTDWKTRSIPTLRHATGFLKEGPVPKGTKRKRSV